MQKLSFNEIPVSSRLVYSMPGSLHNPENFLWVNIKGSYHPDSQIKKSITTTKAGLKSVIQSIHKGIDRAINQLFGDWTTFSNELEFE